MINIYNPIHIILLTVSRKSTCRRYALCRFASCKFAPLSFAPCKMTGKELKLKLEHKLKLQEILKDANNTNK